MLDSSTSRALVSKLGTDALMLLVILEALRLPSPAASTFRYAAIELRDALKGGTCPLEKMLEELKLDV